MKKYIVLLFCLTVILVSCENAIKGDSNFISSLKLETEDLTKRNISDFNVYFTDRYAYSIYLKIEPRNRENVPKIFFDIKVYNPKVTMNSVAISALLPNEAYQYINASHLSFTNIDAVDSGTPKKYFRLIPGNEEIKGIAIGRTFILNPNEKIQEEGLLNIASNVKIKVNWVDDTGKVHIDYLRMPKDMITIDERLFN